MYRGLRLSEEMALIKKNVPELITKSRLASERLVEHVKNNSKPCPICGKRKKL